MIRLAIGVTTDPSGLVGDLPGDGDEMVDAVKDAARRAECSPVFVHATECGNFRFRDEFGPLEVRVNGDDIDYECEVDLRTLVEVCRILNEQLDGCEVDMLYEMYADLTGLDNLAAARKVAETIHNRGFGIYPDAEAAARDYVLNHLLEDFLRREPEARDAVHDAMQYLDCERYLYEHMQDARGCEVYEFGPKDRHGRIVDNSEIVVFFS